MGLQLKFVSTILLPCFLLLIAQSTVTCNNCRKHLSTCSYLVEALLLEGVGEVVLLVLGEEEVVVEEVEVQHQVQVVVGEEGVLVQMMVGEEVVLHLSFVLPLL